MGLITFLIIGLLAGWLAGKITQGGGFGLLGNLIVGVLGAFTGGLVFGAFGLAATNFIGSLITSTVGAIVFLFILSLIKRK